MSNFLAIDTSSKYLTVLAQKGKNKALRHLPECAMQHSVILMGEIERALDELRLTPAGCDFFAAVTGPGSFTGIRIGIAAVKGFALAAGKPVRGVTAFDLIAYNVNSKKFLAVIDAAHSHYYACGYADGKITLPPAYLSAAEVSALKLPLCGIEDLPLGNYTRLDAASCLEKAVLSCPDADGLHALYVRKSQAEEALYGNKKLEL